MALLHLTIPTITSRAAYIAIVDLKIIVGNLRIGFGFFQEFSLA